MIRYYLLFLTALIAVHDCATIVDPKTRGSFEKVREEILTNIQRIHNLNEDFDEDDFKSLYTGASVESGLAVGWTPGQIELLRMKYLRVFFKMVFDRDDEALVKWADSYLEWVKVTDDYYVGLLKEKLDYRIADAKNSSFEDLRTKFLSDNEYLVNELKEEPFKDLYEKASMLSAYAQHWSPSDIKLLKTYLKVFLKSVFDTNDMGFIEWNDEHTEDVKYMKNKMSEHRFKNHVSETFVHLLKQQISSHITAKMI